MNARFLRSFFVPLVTLSAGCSVINTFDDVKPLSSSNAGSGGSSAGSGGTIGGGTGGSTGGSTSGNGGTAGGGAGGSTGGSGGTAGGTGGAAGEAGTSGTGGGGMGGAGTGGGGMGGGGSGGAPPLKGALVMSGLVPGTPDKKILSVIDMGTGLETTREEMIVAGIVHDGISDTFFVFDSATETDPAPGDMVTLRARKLDMATGKWLADAGTVTVPPNARGTAVALQNRIVFLTYPGGMGTKRSLVVVDTKDLGAMKVLPDTGMTFTTSEANALIGARDNTATGGVLGLAGLTPCNSTMKTCDASILPISVTDSGITYLARKTIGSYEFTVGASMAFVGGNDRFLAAFPPVPPAKGYVQGFTTTSVSKAGSPAPFDASGPALKAMAYDECDDISFVSELTDQAIYIVPSDTSKQAALQSLGKPGQRVVFDNATKTVIVPYSVTAQHFIRAFKLDPTKPAKPLSERVADWKPPTDFEPDFAAARNANPLCP